MLKGLSYLHTHDSNGKNILVLSCKKFGDGDALKIVNLLKQEPSLEVDWDKLTIMSDYHLDNNKPIGYLVDRHKNVITLMLDTINE